MLGERGGASRDTTSKNKATIESDRSNSVAPSGDDWPDIEEIF